LTLINPIKGNWTIVNEEKTGDFSSEIVQNVADTVSLKRLISVQAILPQVLFTSTRCLAKVSVTMGNQNTSGHG